MRFSRALLLLACAAVGSFALLLLGATPASAHAVLERATPAAGSVLHTAPARVTLTFGEPVTVAGDAIRVYDDHLRRADRGGSDHAGGRADTVGVRLRPHLPAGTYTVTWRVVSADTHPVSGGVTFSVGHPSTVAGAVHGEAGGSRLVGVLLGTARLAGFVGIVGLGVAFALFVLWPGGREDRRARRLVWTGWGLLVAGTVGGLLLQGPYGAGDSIAHLHLAATLDTRFGVLSLVRLGLLAVLAAVLVAGGAPALTVLGLGVLVTVAAAGHAGTGSQLPLALASDVTHLAAMAVWLGGLALVLACLLRADRAGTLAAVLPRFSRWAFASVAVIVVTGTYQSWREVGAWDALVHTPYGRLLLAKICCADVLVALGNLARMWVRRHYLAATGGLLTPRVTAYAQDAGEPAGPSRGAVTALRRGLAAEIVVGVVVLVLTTVLVNTAQARETFAPRYTTSATANGTRLQVTLDRAHTGPATIGLRVTTPGGAAQHVQRVTGALSLPAQQVGPLPVDFTGTQALTAFSVPGRWLLDVTVQTSDTDATAFRVTLPIR